MDKQPQHRYSLTLSGFLISLCGSILFSTKAIFVKLAFAASRVDALELLSLRMLFSLPFYLVVGWMIARNNSLKPLTRKQWIHTFLMGVLGYYLSSLFDFIGLQYVSAGLERLILFLYPTFSVLINTFLFKAKLSRIQITALILTYAGIGLAYFGELRVDTANPHFFYGSFMIFLCAITYSFYLVGTGRLVKSMGDTRYTAYAMLFATLGIFVHFTISKSVTTMVFTPTLLWYGVILALVATVLPSFLLSNAMKRIGSNNVSIISSIGPVSTILQAHFILGEKIFIEQIIGTLLVVLGVVLIGWRSN